MSYVLEKYKDFTIKTTQGCTRKGAKSSMSHRQHLYTPLFINCIFLSIQKADFRMVVFLFKELYPQNETLNTNCENIPKKSEVKGGGRAGVFGQCIKLWSFF